MKDETDILALRLISWFVGGVRKRAIVFGITSAILVAGIGTYLGTITQPAIIVSTNLNIGSVGAVGLVMPDFENHGGKEASRLVESVRFYGLEPGRRLLIAPTELYRNLLAEYQVVAGRKGGLELPYLANMDGYKSTTLRLDVRAASEQQGREFLAMIVQRIQDEHDPIFQESVRVLRGLEKLVDGEIERESLASSEASSLTQAALIHHKYEISRALTPINTRPTTYTKFEVNQETRNSFFKISIFWCLVGLFSGYLVMLAMSVISAIRRAKQEGLI